MADVMEQVQPLIDTTTEALQSVFTQAEPFITSALDTAQTVVGQISAAASDAYTQIEPQLATVYTALEPAFDAGHDAYAKAQPHLESALHATEDVVSPYVDMPRWGNILSKGFHLACNQSATTSAFAEEGLSDEPFPWTRAVIPVAGCLVYLLLVINLMPKDNKGPRTGGFILRFFSVLHNLGLMLFSYATFINISPLVKHAVYDLHLSAGEVLIELTDKHWDTLGFWSWLFYLSKFYEFIDTFTVIAKNRRPIALQYIHHVGAVLTMWGLLVLRTPGMLPFVYFNSFVHTIMYAYYMITSFGIKLRFLRPVITMMQISQFIAGTLWSSIPYFIEGGIKNEGQMVISALSHFYVTLLLGMFIQFALKNYCGCGKRSKSKKEKKSESSSPSSSDSTASTDSSSRKSKKNRSSKKQTLDAAPATPITKSGKSPRRRK